MDVLDAIKGRRSIRRYSLRMVEDEKLEKVLEAARLSPSARNYQAWKFVVVKDRETKKNWSMQQAARLLSGRLPLLSQRAEQTPTGS